VPSWAKDSSIGSRLINARVETVADKPAFKRAFASRRCLLPADGYYEWYPMQASQTSAKGKPKALKQPFFVSRPDGRSLAMAGLYEWWRDPAKEVEDPASWMLSTVVITTSATDEVGRIHDRMPLLVDASGWKSWLSPDVAEHSELRPLLQPAIAGGLQARAVSTQVNNVRNNGPELIEPLPFDDASLTPFAAPN